MHVNSANVTICLKMFLLPIVKIVNPRICLNSLSIPIMLQFITLLKVILSKTNRTSIQFVEQSNNVYFSTDLDNFKLISAFCLKNKILTIPTNTLRKIWDILVKLFSFGLKLNIQINF